MKRTVSATIPEGGIGVWHLPRFPIYVPLYSSVKGVKTIQDVVDDPHSAVYMPWGNGHLIVDHANSKHGIVKWKVNEFKLDDKAYLFLPNEIRRYICTAILRVKIEGGRYVYEGHRVYPQLPADILCACCTEVGPQENYLAYFKFDGIEEEENNV